MESQPNSFKTYLSDDSTRSASTTSMNPTWAQSNFLIENITHLFAKLDNVAADSIFSPKMELLHFIEPLEDEIDNSKLILPNENSLVFNDSANTDLSFIRFEKIVECLTNPFAQYNEMFDICLYGYHFFTELKQLFLALINRFRIAPPMNLNEADLGKYIQSTLKIVQLKVMIYLEFWFKTYKHTTLTDPTNREIFLETLYLIGISKYRGKWVTLPLTRLMKNFEALEIPKITFIEAQTKSFFHYYNNRFSDLYRSVLKYGYNLIFTNRKELARQLTLFDYENFSTVPMMELVEKMKPSSSSKPSPNIKYVTDTFNTLSQLISFLLLHVTLKKPGKKVSLFENLIDLIDELVKLSNFHSAYAIYLGLMRTPIDRLKKIFLKKIGKSAKVKFTKQSELFDPCNNQTPLREAQNKALTPCVPFLGVYFKDLIMIDESYKQKKHENMIHYNKICLLSSIVKRISIFKESSYNQPKIKPFQDGLFLLPKISEDYLYELSYFIMPMQETYD